MKTTNLIQFARSQLILNLFFFGSLALKLKLRETPGLGTCATDGEYLIYDPAMLPSWSKDELEGIVAHEILHCALHHFIREDNLTLCKFGFTYSDKIKNRIVDTDTDDTVNTDELYLLYRIHQIWNQATDYAINHIVIDAGLKLPSDALFNDEYKDKSSEEIFDILWNGNKNDSTACAWGQVQPGEKTSVTDKKEQARDWKIAVSQAAKAASARGTLSGGLSQFIDEFLAPKILWKTLLWDFVERSSSNDYSWLVPRRKYMSQGIYLPSMIADEIPLIVFVTDTSGSMYDDELKQAGGELQSILNTFNTTLMAIFADCDIKDENIRIFEQGDLIDIKFTGRGGTSFKPVFEYIEKNDIQPSCLIYLTDMDGDFPSDEPDYPVMWVDTRDSGGNPFGERIVMKVNEIYM